MKKIFIILVLVILIVVLMNTGVYAMGNRYIGLGRVYSGNYNSMSNWNSMNMYNFMSYNNMHSNSFTTMHNNHRIFSMMGY